MEERTRAYLRGRFRDHYRRTEVSPPPDAHEREWAYVPWTEGPGTTMVRHRSLLDLGEPGDFLARESPQHAYISVGRYDDPGANSMAEKGWRSSDLVFDLDADHLPSVTLGEDTYAEMLATCKQALLKLLSFLEDDFGFSDLQVVFSGGRGYHVHVRDDGIQHLEREQRREIVDYVRGIGVEFDAILEREPVAGLGRSTPTHRRSIDRRGGWGLRAHRRIVAFVEELTALEDEDALSRLESFEGVGEKRASAALRAARTNREQIEEGNVDVHPAFVGVARQLFEETVEREQAPIDEPVTTDTNRLIRIPGTLHGGSGLSVCPLEREEIAAFDPLVDAVPETFRGHEITVEVTDGGPVELGGDTFTVAEGDTSVPEYVGVFLMARGRAEKGKERST